MKKKSLLLWGVHVGWIRHAKTTRSSIGNDQEKYVPPKKSLRRCSPHMNLPSVFTQDVTALEVQNISHINSKYFHPKKSWCSSKVVKLSETMLDLYGEPDLPPTRTPLKTTLSTSDCLTPPEDVGAGKKKQDENPQRCQGGPFPSGKSKTAT